MWLQKKLDKPLSSVIFLKVTLAINYFENYPNSTLLTRQSPAIVVWTRSPLRSRSLSRSRNPTSRLCSGRDLEQRSSSVRDPSTSATSSRPTQQVSGIIPALITVFDPQLIQILKFPETLKCILNLSTAELSRQTRMQPLERLLTTKIKIR